MSPFAMLSANSGLKFEMTVPNETTTNSVKSPSEMKLSLSDGSGLGFSGSMGPTTFTWAPKGLGKSKAKSFGIINNPVALNTSLRLENLLSLT